MRSAFRHNAIVCMAACTWLLVGTPVGAQEAPGTWRCGNTYTDQPCKGGKAVALGDARSALQERDAEQSTQRAQAAADRMERDRLRSETAQARQGHLAHIEKPRATPTATPTAPAGASHVKGKKGRKEPDFFTAGDPDSKARKKATKTTKAKAAGST